MKLLFTTTLLAFFLSPDPGNLRNLYQKGAHDESKVKELLNLCSRNPGSPLYLGYTGAAKMLMAKHAFNPLTKYNWFSEGRSLLEQAIQSDRSNPELRYIRLSIQINTPAFLGYKNEMAADRAFLQLALPVIKDEQLKLLIQNLLNQNL